MTVDELKKGLATLCNASKANKEKIRRIELQVASDGKLITHLTPHVKGHRWICFCATGENGELQRMVHNIEEKSLEKVLFAEQFLV